MVCSGLVVQRVLVVICAVLLYQSSSAESVGSEY